MGRHKVINYKQSVVFNPFYHDLLFELGKRTGIESIKKAIVLRCAVKLFIDRYVENGEEFEGFNVTVDDPRMFAAKSYLDKDMRKYTSLNLTDEYAEWYVKIMNRYDILASRLSELCILYAYYHKDFDVFKNIYCEEVSKWTTQRCQKRVATRNESNII